MVEIIYNESCTARSSSIVDIYLHSLSLSLFLSLIHTHTCAGSVGAEVRKVCSALLTIAPVMESAEGFSSMNVAVTAGIILHSLQYRNKC